MKLSGLFLGAAFGWVFWAIVALVKNAIAISEEKAEGDEEVNSSPPRVTVSILTFSFGAVGLGIISWILVSLGF